MNPAVARRLDRQSTIYNWDAGINTISIQFAAGKVNQQVGQAGAGRGTPQVLPVGRGTIPLGRAGAERCHLRGFDTLVIPKGSRTRKKPSSSSRLSTARM